MSNVQKTHHTNDYCKNKEFFMHVAFLISNVKYINRLMSRIKMLN